MTLDILIPQYKETNEVIKSLLDSIALQQKVNFNAIGAIIVNDGSDVFLDEDFLKSYPFKIRYIKNAHKGVSATRQKALDESKADYVMFCDADDMFFNMCGLYLIFNEMAKNFDILTPVFLEEAYVLQTKDTALINRNVDVTHVHGKVFRRQYLVDKNIRWDERLTVHEDSYFVTLAYVNTKNIVEFKTPYYLWKWRDSSVCRNDPLYLLKTYQIFIKSNEYLIEELFKRDMVQEAKYFFNVIFYDMFFIMNKKDWLLKENQHYVENILKKFAKHYKKYKQLLDIDTQLRINIIQSERQKYYNDGVFFDSIRFEDWFARVQELCKD